MLEKESFKTLLNYIFIIILFILAAIIIRPILFAILYGVLFAYIFYPVYKLLLKKIKSEKISAAIICIVLLLIVIISFTLLIGTLINQASGIYSYLQNTDLGEEIKETIPFIYSSDITAKISEALEATAIEIMGKIANATGSFILDIPFFIFQILIFFITLFFLLKDGKKVLTYIVSVSPLKKDIQEKFFHKFRDITKSVLIGQIVIGILQGVIAGIGYYIFGVPNALLFTVLTMAVGMIPIIGPQFVWLPINLYLFLVGRTGSGIGLLIYGFIFINWIDPIVKPLIISKRTKLNPGIILIGMIGGLFVFGLIGFIIGPLILAYVLLVLELYKPQEKDSRETFKKINDYRLRNT
ncbi:MAG: AI-2E family transporter [archaeon]